MTDNVILTEAQSNMSALLHLFVQCIMTMLRIVLVSAILFCPHSQVSIYEGDKKDCRKFCTTGIDGAMTIWDFKVCSK